MPRIQILSDQLINQIAAGEMIDRPASIIKELIENSIDANSTKIHVSFVGGGIKEIIINDNGDGIDKEDLQLSLVRHATSKISQYHDLQNISSLGFRGEALASIASAAYLEIISSTDGKDAFKISAEGGKINKIIPANREQGTTIIVRDLFFNIPARRQFLKKEMTEASHCLEACLRLALINPQIAFTINKNGKNCWQVNSENKNTRIKNLLGQDLFNNSREINNQDILNSQPLSIQGILALPQAINSSKDQQYLYINSRYVRDRTIFHAIREGYGEMKHDSKNLAYVIYINLSPAEIDVNVSPQKTEVRFRNPQIIHSFTQNSVHKSLSELIGQYPAPIISLDQFSRQEQNNNLSQDHQNSIQNNAQPKQSMAASFAPRPTQSYKFNSHSNNYAHQVNSSIQLFNQTLAKDDNSNQPVLTDNIPPLGYALGLLHNLYIIAQNTKGLVIVEIHAAHERIIFEKLKLQINNQINSQNLIVPWQIKLNSIQINTFKEFKTNLQKIGIYAELKNQLLEVSAIPMELKNQDLQLIVINILNDLEEFGNSSEIESIYEQVFATIACHTAMRGQQQMTIDQMNFFLREMETIERSGSCNHGRPTYSIIPIADLDKKFMRGQ